MKVKSGVGVVIGRFQVPELSKGHVNIFEAAMENHTGLMVILGSSSLRNTKRNPLDFETRRRMISDIYPDATILNLMDTPDDATWVKNLDALIASNIPPGTDVTLYGSRGSFLHIYDEMCGKYKTVEVPHCDQSSGTEARKAVSLEQGDTINFRKGMIKASQQRYNTVVMCVDVAPMIMNAEGSKPESIIMIKKNEDMGKLRFVGGHVEPSNFTSLLEHTVHREAQEEAGVNILISSIHYIGSYQVPDWRYRGESDVIVTAFFTGNCCESNPTAGDDANEVVVVHIKDILDGNIDIVHEHEDLLDGLVQYLKSLS